VYSPALIGVTSSRIPILGLKLAVNLNESPSRFFEQLYFIICSSLKCFTPTTQLASCTGLSAPKLESLSGGSPRLPTSERVAWFVITTGILYVWLRSISASV